MAVFFIYLLKVIVCSALFTGCYWCFLRKGSFHHWNRFHIMASVVLSIIIPLLNIYLPLLHSVTIPSATGYVTQIMMEQNEQAAVPTQIHSLIFTLTLFGWIVFIIFVCFFLTKEIVSLIRVLRLKRRSERVSTPETVLYCTDDAAAPFTFFRSIFWKKGISVYSSEGRCMLRHELAHVRFGHSWDKALMQLVCCLFWINPFFTLLRRELELVHEFAADSETINDGNIAEFSSLILCTLYPEHYNDFFSRFYQSSIKKRIIMITKDKKTSMNMLRKMSIVPVALVAMYLFSCNSESRQNGEKKTLVTEDAKTVLFSEVDTKPTFNGIDAETGFREYIRDNTVYPSEAQENGVSGRIFVEFVIDIDGSVTDVKLLRGADPLLDNAALQVVSSSPKWTPGKDKNGKAVKVQYQFPVYFQLNDESSSSNAKSSTVADTQTGDEVLFALVHIKPTFNGKDAETGFREYINNNTVYPVEAQNKGITGRVFVEFTIDTDGSVVNVRLLRGADPLLDAETLRVIKASPKWTPGKHKDGKTVKVKYQFPVSFSLNQ